MNIKKLIYYATYIYLVLNFIVYINPLVVRYIDYAYMIGVGFLLICYFLTHKIAINKIHFLYFIALILLVIYQISNNNYGYYDIFKNTFFAIATYFIFNNGIIDEYNKNQKFDLIYWICCAYLSYFLIISYRNGTLLSEYNDFYLLCTGDKNWSGLVMFFFMYLCYKKKYKVGFLLSILYILFLKCRMVQFGIIIFAIVEVLLKSKLSNKILEKLKLETFNANKAFIVIALSQILIIVISYYITFYIPVSQITNYRESLLDGSNAMRVRANVYAVEQIRNNKYFIYSGLDDKIKDVMGVENISKSKRYLGFRLVQPHSLFLNLALRYGIIYSVVYLLFISNILKEYFVKKNFALLVSYIFMNMVLPFLFSTCYLIFLLFILSINDKEGKEEQNENISSYPSESRIKRYT